MIDRTSEEIALAVREHIVRLSGRGGCFIGASLSCTDLIVHMYRDVLRITPDRLDAPDRDTLLLSKGHDVPALYGTLVELGFVDSGILERHLQPGSPVYWHPNVGVPGVEFHSGSLGHLLPVGAGIALADRLAGRDNLTVVIVGDGELNEGSNWEALMVAAAHRLGRLVVVVDRNGFQANLPTEQLIPLEPLAARFEAFGSRVTRVDGHDFGALARAFADVREDHGVPKVVIADTVRGKGLPSLEHRAERWFASFTADEVDQLVQELRNGDRALLTTGGKVVR